MVAGDGAKGGGCEDDEVVIMKDQRIKKMTETRRASSGSLELLRLRCSPRLPVVVATDRTGCGSTCNRSTEGWATEAESTTRQSCEEIKQNGDDKPIPKDGEPPRQDNDGFGKERIRDPKAID